MVSCALLYSTTSDPPEDGRHSLGQHRASWEMRAGMTVWSVKDVGEWCDGERVSRATNTLTISCCVLVLPVRVECRRPWNAEDSHPSIVSTTRQ